MYIHVITYNQGEGSTKGDRDMEEAREILGSMTLMDLIDEWELTTTVSDPAISEVRGWLMDEIERREPKGFNAWLEQEDPRDEDLKHYVIR